jgi:hypothetical protein
VAGGNTYAFVKYTNSRMPQWPGLATYTGRTVAQCASLCRAGAISFAAPRPRGALSLSQGLSVRCW